MREEHQQKSLRAGLQKTWLFLEVLLLLALLHAVASAAWSSFGGEETGGGRQDAGVGPSSPPSILLHLLSTELWTPLASPIVTPLGIVVLGAERPCAPGTCDRGIVMHSLGGTRMWSFNTTEPVASTPAADGSSVYVADLGGHVWALSVTSGSILWTLSTGAPISAPLSILPGETSPLLLAASVQGDVYCVRMKDGLLRWVHRPSLIPTERGTAVTAAPWASPDKLTVYFAGENGVVHALDAQSGSVKWTFRTDASFTATGVAHPMGRSIFAANNDGLLYSLSATGQVRWFYKSPSPIQHSLALLQGVPFTPTAADGPDWWLTTIAVDGVDETAQRDLLVCIAQDGTMRAFRASDGRLVWSAASIAGVQSSPSAGGAIVYSTVSGVAPFASRSFLFARNASDGSELWSREMGGNISSTPAVHSGSVYVGSSDGAVVGMCCGSCRTVVVNTSSIDANNTREEPARLQLSNANVAWFSRVVCVVEGIESPYLGVRDGVYSCAIPQGMLESGIRAHLRLVRACTDTALPSQCVRTISPDAGGTAMDCLADSLVAKKQTAQAPPATPGPTPMDTPGPFSFSSFLSSLPIWALILLIMGLVALGICVAFCAVYFCLRRKGRSERVNADDSATEGGRGKDDGTRQDAVGGWPQHGQQARHGQEQRIVGGSNQGHASDEMRGAGAGQLTGVHVRVLEAKGLGVLARGVSSYVKLKCGVDAASTRAVFSVTGVPKYNEDVVLSFARPLVSGDAPVSAHSGEDWLWVELWECREDSGDLVLGRVRILLNQVFGPRTAWYALDSSSLHPGSAQTSSSSGAATPGGSATAAGGGTSSPGPLRLSVRLAVHPQYDGSTATMPDPTPRTESRDDFDVDAMEVELYGNPAPLKGNNPSMVNMRDNEAASRSFKKRSAGRAIEAGWELDHVLGGGSYTGSGSDTARIGSSGSTRASSHAMVHGGSHAHGRLGAPPTTGATAGVALQGSRSFDAVLPWPAALHEEQHHRPYVRPTRSQSSAQAEQHPGAAGGGAVPLDPHHYIAAPHPPPILGSAQGSTGPKQKPGPRAFSRARSGEAPAGGDAPAPMPQARGPTRWRRPAEDTQAQQHHAPHAHAALPLSSENIHKWHVANSILSQRPAAHAEDKAAHSATHICPSPDAPLATMQAQQQLHAHRFPHQEDARSGSLETAHGEMLAKGGGKMLREDVALIDNDGVVVFYDKGDSLRRTCYVGAVDEDKLRHGRGTMWWSDGSCYEGDWHRDVPHGYGLESYADGSWHGGTFKNDERHGWGIYSSDERSSFAGDWVEGVLQGLAVISVVGARALRASQKDGLSDRAEAGDYVVFPLTVENGQLQSNPDTGPEKVDEFLLHVVEKSLGITVGLTDKAVTDARQKVMKHRQMRLGAAIPPSPTTKIAFTPTTHNMRHGGGGAAAASNAAAATTTSTVGAAASNKTQQNSTKPTGVGPVGLSTFSTLPLAGSATSAAADAAARTSGATQTHGGIAPEDMNVNPLKHLYTRLADQTRQGISPLSGSRHEFGNTATRPRLGFREGVVRDS